MGVGSDLGGLPKQILDLVREGRLTPVTSPALLAELNRVLGYPKLKLTSADRRLHISRVKRLCSMVVPRKAVTVVQVDPSDNRVLECAVAGHADAIITGDRHLLDLKRLEGIVLLSPAEWLSQHSRR